MWTVCVNTFISNMSNKEKRNVQYFIRLVFWVNWTPEGLNSLFDLL